MFGMLHTFFNYMNIFLLSNLRGSRLRVSDNKVLKRIFVSKTEEITGEWRRLHDEELNDLHC